MTFIERVAQNRRSPFSPRDRLRTDLCIILVTFRGRFGDVLCCLFDVCYEVYVFSNSKKGTVDPDAVTYGSPGQGKGGGVNPSP